MNKVPESARALGYAGLLPQAAALLAVIKGGSLSWTAMALAYGYAALIFSFIGGAWWGSVWRSRKRRAGSFWRRSRPA